MKASNIRPYMYGLSTCGWCAKARNWLDNNLGADQYDLVYVDLLDQPEKDKVIQELREKIDNVAFPIVFFDEISIVGYKPDQYEDAIIKKGK